MHRRKNFFCLALIGVWALAMFAAGPVLADVTAEPGYQANNDFAELDPAAFAWHGSTAWYNGYLIYVDNVGKIMAYNTQTKEISCVCNNTFLLTGEESAPAGFLVTKEGYLYFHSNATPSQTLYRINLTWAWPTIYDSLPTNCNGSISSLSQNPWTGAVWFASTTYEEGDWAYLYEVNATFSGVAEWMDFSKPRGGDNGPIIWKMSNSLLYGESVIDGNGYFHQVNPGYENQDMEYISFDGGLAGAVHAWNNEIYAATGDGKEIYRINEQTKTKVAQTDYSAQSLAFDGTTLFISEIISDTGKMSFSALTCVSSTERLAAESPYTSMAFEDEEMLPIFVTLSMTGFLYTSDNYFYNHDFQDLNTMIYRTNIENNNVISVETNCDGSIIAFAENPWTKEIYFASSDLDGQGDNMYLYNIENGPATITATKVLTMTKFHGGCSGPIIFENPDTLLYGECGNCGNGYFHEVDIAARTVISDCMEFDGGLVAATHGFGYEIFVATYEGDKIYSIDNRTKTLVATTLAGPAVGLGYDGHYSLIVVQPPPQSKAEDDPLIDFLWVPQQRGVLGDEQASKSAVSESAQMSINTAYGNGVIGVQGNTSTSIEFLEAMSIDDIEDTENKPGFMPFGLINFRAKGNASGFTATVKVHFSHRFPSDTQWWKYDRINGWYEYDLATLSDDGMTMTLEILDGGYGDADGKENGYVTDPGGPAYPKRHSGVKNFPGWTSDCFIGASRQVSDHLPQKATWALLAVFLAGMLIFGRITIKHEP